MQNLLVTYEPSHRGRAEGEAKAALDKIGEKAKIEDGGPGVFLAAVSDPKKAVKKLAKAGALKYTFRWVPIEKWVPSDTAKMQQAVKELKLDKSKSWKLELSKRQHKATDLIEKLTEPVDNKNVDLEKPEQIIKVEILGKKAGISLLSPSEILNTQKPK